MSVISTEALRRAKGLAEKPAVAFQIERVASRSVHEQDGGSVRSSASIFAFAAHHSDVSWM